MTITISSFASLISTVPVALGRAPHHAVVALTTNGKRLNATLRVDLPDRMDPDWMDTFAGYIGKAVDNGADTVFLLAYSNGQTGDGEPFYRDEMQALAAYLTMVLPVRVADMALVTDEYWCSYADGARRPIAEVECSTYVAEVVANGLESVNVTVIPAVREDLDPDFTAAVEARADSSGRFGMDGDRALYLLWNDLLTGTEMEPHHMVRLLAGCRDLGTRDGLAVRVLVPRIEVDDYGPVLLGQLDTPFDRARYDRGLALVNELLTRAAGAERAHLLSIAGWLHWHRGRGSDAVEHFDAALDHTPGLRLAELLKQFVMGGRLSGIAEVAANWAEQG